MDKIIEAILDLLPFGEWLIAAGLNEKQSVGFSAILSLTLLYLLNEGRKKGMAHYQNSKTAKSLVHYTYQEVQKAKEYFIDTKAQSLSPTIEEELKTGTKFIPKVSLIDHFLKTAFNEKEESDKFYLVLADSGMGKTTFMLNLYMRYYSVLNFGRKYEMKLLPFRDDKILDDLKEIAKDKKKASKTILLLDAFDEYKGLLPPKEPDGLSNDERFRKRLDEIVELVQYCREVVITSRSQYFPGQEKEDFTLKVPKYGSNGFHVLAKLYLSPFDEREIEQYLNKKFGRWKFWNNKKKALAWNIVDTSPKLMVRPMLLAYIDYLMAAKTDFKNTYEVYETLVERWLEREANKRKHEVKHRKKFKKDLYAFSRLVAIQIHYIRLNSGSFSISYKTGKELCRTHDLDLDDYEMTGQSLLTRDANHNWKFAHKSILEFFLAKEAIDNSDFYTVFDFTGMDMVKLFCREKGVADFILIKGGTFLMGSPESEVDRNEKDETPHEVKLSDFYMLEYTVTLAQFEVFIQITDYQTDADKNGSSRIWNGKEWKDKKGINWKCDVSGKIQTEKQHPVIHVSWNDATAYAKWLSEKENRQYDLPTEAQWEYACRAGTTTPFYTGENLTTEQANYNGNYPYNGNAKGKYLEKTTPVGTYKPNDFGLYDMHGNVWEWCNDWYGEKYYEECKQQGIVENPEGSKIGDYKVLRGGSWNFIAQFCRSARRYTGTPDYRNDLIGFRLVCSPVS